MEIKTTTEQLIKDEIARLEGLVDNPIAVRNAEICKESLDIYQGLNGKAQKSAQDSFTQVGGGYRGCKEIIECREMGII